jgi:hypothetical protein
MANGDYGYKKKKKKPVNLLKIRIIFWIISWAPNVITKVFKSEREKPGTVVCPCSPKYLQG